MTKPTDLHASDFSSKPPSLSDDKDLFNTGWCQVSRNECLVQLFHKMSIKEMARESIAADQDSKLTASDLGACSRERVPVTEVLSSSLRHGVTWGRVRVSGPIWASYGIRISAIRMTREDEITEDEAEILDRKGSVERRRERNRSGSTLARLESEESEYKPSDSEEKTFVDVKRISIGEDGLVADLKVSEAQCVRKGSKVSKASKASKEDETGSVESVPKITFDVSFEIRFGLLLLEEEEGEK